MEEMEFPVCTYLMEEGSYFLQYFSEGKVKDSLRSLCVGPAGELRKNTINFLSGLTSLVSLKLELGNATRIEIEKSEKQLSSQLPLLDRKTLFLETKNKEKKDKKEGETEEKIVTTGEKRFAMVNCH